MAVHAHPDDESSKGAATYAYYSSIGAEVMIVSCTGGERGDILNDQLADLPMAKRDLPGLRRREMAVAQAVLGVDHRWLGYVDSGMASEDGSVPFASFADIPAEISTGVLVRLVREFKPQVMITYDEKGGYPHPDHIRSHVIGAEAYRLSGDPDAYPAAGAPWTVSKLYYDRVFNARRMKTLHDALVAQEPDSPLLEDLDQMQRWLRDEPFLATTQVPVGAFFSARDDALRAHASQVSPTSSFFFWPNHIQENAWPYEDYQLIDSKVETSTPEADLFAGVDDE